MRNQPDSRPRLAGVRMVGAAPVPREQDDYRKPWFEFEAGEADPRLRVGAAAEDGPAAVGWTPTIEDPDLLASAVPDSSSDGAAGRSQVEPDSSVTDSRPHGRERSGRPHRAGRRRFGSRLTTRWVPESLREARIDPGRRGALLLTLVAAVAALVAAVGVWWDRPTPRPVESVSLAQLSQSSAGAVGGGGSLIRAAMTTDSAGDVAARRSSTAARSGTVAAPTRAAAVIVVSVTGAVRRPGLVRLTSGARVADAIEKAGGATAQANLTGLNLAEKLSDGASVVVSDVAATPNGSGSSVSGSDLSGSGSAAGGASAATPVSGSPTGKVDLNTADVAALDALPGVGPVTAAGIVSWREKNGRFTAVEQLQEIPGIGPAKYASLSALVTV